MLDTLEDFMKINIAVFLATTLLVVNGCAILRVIPPPNIDVKIDENITSRVRGSSITVYNTTDEPLVGMVGEDILGIAKPNGGWQASYPDASLTYNSFSVDFAVRALKSSTRGASQAFTVCSYSRAEIWFVAKDTVNNRLYFYKQ